MHIYIYKATAARTDTHNVRQRTEMERERERERTREREKERESDIRKGQGPSPVHSNCPCSGGKRRTSSSTCAGGDAHIGSTEHLVRLRRRTRENEPRAQPSSQNNIPSSARAALMIATDVPPNPLQVRKLSLDRPPACPTRPRGERCCQPSSGTTGTSSRPPGA
jgi:hypothetical protein